MLTESIQFSELKLAEPLLQALSEEGYTHPTPIQAKTIPATMSGKDVLGCAQTGTGKTAAFALPILHQLLTTPMDKSHRGRPLARTLVLSPTRELATQIAESFKTYGRYTGVTGTTIYGGVGQGSQVRDLQRGVDVIVATPGRLLDLMEQGYVDLSGIKTFVLDEADRMLDMGFIKPIRDIAARVPKGRQTLLFSATMPKEIQHLAESLMTDPVRVAVTPVASMVPKIEQRLYHVPRARKLGLLLHLMEKEAATRVVVFSKTKHGSDKLCKRLVQMGVSATAIHGNKAQNQRDRALDAFKLGRVKVLVATDVAARGLDVDGISHVFNYDLPMEPEAYVHRIGRTGRAGAAGIAISFCDHEERDLLRQIERLTKKAIPTLPLPEGVQDVAMKDSRLDAQEEAINPTPAPRERRFHPQGQPQRREQRGYAPRGGGQGGRSGGGYAGGGSGQSAGYSGGHSSGHSGGHEGGRGGERGERSSGNVGFGGGGQSYSGGGYAGGSGGGSGGGSHRPSRPSSGGSSEGGRPSHPHGAKPAAGPNKDKGKPKWAAAGKGKMRRH